MFWIITGKALENIFQNQACVFHRNRFCFYLWGIQICSVFVLCSSVIYWHASSHKIFAYIWESNCSDTFCVCQEVNASVQCNWTFKTRTGTRTNGSIINIPMKSQLLITTHFRHSVWATYLKSLPICMLAKPVIKQFNTPFPRLEKKYVIILYYSICHMQLTFRWEKQQQPKSKHLKLTLWAVLEQNSNIYTCREYVN